MSSVKDLLRGDVVDGSGTANNVAKWSDADTITDSVIYDDGTNVGIGTSSPEYLLDLHIATADGISTPIRLVNSSTFSLSPGQGSQIGFVNDSGFGSLLSASIRSQTENIVNGAANLTFNTWNGTSLTEKMRINSAGEVLIGATVNNFSAKGTLFNQAGQSNYVADNANIAFYNRLTSDGSLLEFYQAGSLEGSISVSGTTVSYNGGHLARWSQLIDKTKDETIVKGTVLSNLNEMCEWKRVTFEYQELVSEEDTYETKTMSESYGGDANVGDVIEWEYEGETVQATVILEENEQLNRMKVSDVEGDANVAGVFVNWDNDDDVNTADMNIAMTGDMVIRIGKDVTVQRGDLLMSAGDGTAKPQGDDIVRSKTIAKITSTNVSHTYADGSYLVPCVLMAC